MGHGGGGCFLDSGEFFVCHAGVLGGAGVGDGDELVGVHGCHVVQAGGEECDVVWVVFGELGDANEGLVGQAAEGPFDAVGQDPVVGLRFDAVGHGASYGDGH